MQIRHGQAVRPVVDELDRSLDFEANGYRLQRFSVARLGDLADGSSFRLCAYFGEELDRRAEINL
jgi:hypothetical protein